jgi:ferrous iron transport protein B
LQEAINRHAHIEKQFPSRWLAIKLLEGDRDIEMHLKVLQGGADVLAAAEKSVVHLEKIYGEDIDVVIADHRYGWITGSTAWCAKWSSVQAMTA